jgi:phage gp29-like protein
VHGKPILKAIVPMSATPAEEREYVTKTAKINAETVVKVRQDKDGNRYDLEFLEAASMGWKGFEAMLAWADGRKSEVICGQAASMDGQGGLNSQENPGSGVRDDIKASDNAKLCETLYTQALREYCEYNYGNPDLAPKPCYQVSPPEDEAEIAATDQKISQALVYFDQAKAPINVRKFLEERGYTLLTEEEEKAMKEAAQQKEADDAAAQREHDMALATAKGGAPSGGDNGVG